MNFNQLALELARERQERLIEEHLRARLEFEPLVHPPVDRSPRHRGRPSDRGGAITRAGPVPLRDRASSPARRSLS